MSLRHILLSKYLLLAAVLAAQTEPAQITRATVQDGDTIPLVQLNELRVFKPFMPINEREKRRYTRLEKNVVKVYPYARVANQLINEYTHDLSQISKENDQDKYIKLAELELKAEFESEIRDLTTSQGRTLIKLIDRETGATSYDLIKQLRGSFQAFVWQGIAKLFGTDLKDEYDAHGEDIMVESIVRRIEQGELAVARRPARTEKAQARLEKRKQRLYKRYGLVYEPTSEIRELEASP